MFHKPNNKFDSLFIIIIKSKKGDDVYLGRILALGTTETGNFVAYRVSSRSFPNRTAKTFEDRVSIVPTEGNEKDVFKNPYIAYNSIRIIEDKAVVSNGGHTDVIADKIASGMSIRDSLALSLLSMDYEKDDFNTPRIAGVTTLGGDSYIGIVTHEDLIVEKLEKGTCAYISTYEQIKPKTVKYEANNAQEAAQYIMDQGKFSEFTNPVTSAAAFGTDNWNLSSI